MQKADGDTTEQQGERVVNTSRNRAGLHPTRGVRLDSRIWSKGRMKTILNRLRKLEKGLVPPLGLVPPVETEAGRRAREANEKLCQRIGAAEARMKALGYECPEPQMPELTESEQAALSRLTLGQRIRYHAQRQRECIAEIDWHNTVAGAVQP